MARLDQDFVAGEGGELIARRWVRLMADSYADGVWDRSGLGASADELPIDGILVERIRRWQAWNDRDEDDRGLFKGDIVAFSQEGLMIARAIKAALPDWTVVYFDAAALEAADEQSVRTDYEYEV